jgi:hypothetical protein
MMGLISVSYRKTCWSKVKNLRIRPVYEMETCIVFTPDNPSLYSLNSTAWLVFDLCDGRSSARLERDYYKAVEPLRSPEEARSELAAILSDLERKGIVERDSVT